MFARVSSETAAGDEIEASISYNLLHFRVSYFTPI